MVKINRKLILPLEEKKEILEDCIYNYGFWLGLRVFMFPPMSAELFYKKVIDYALRKYPGVDYDYIMSLPTKSDNKRQREDINLADIKNLDNLYNGKPLIEYRDNWYERYTFDSEKEYLKFRKYFFKLYPKTKIWKVNKTEIENAFAWFNLECGLRHSYDHTYDE